jgi:hypothetical protein
MEREPLAAQGDLSSGGGMLTIVVRDDIYLSEPRSSDRIALLSHLHDREISDNTLTIPHPFTEADADRFFAIVAEKRFQNCLRAIRRQATLKKA